MVDDQCVNFLKGDRELKNHLFVGALLCLIASVSWGAMFPVAHAAFKHVEPFYFTILRYGGVTLILTALLFLKEGKKAFRFEGKAWRLWFFGTMGFAVYNLLIFWGEDLLGRDGVLTAAIMESLMPMVSIVIVWFVVKKRPHSFTLFCVLLSFIGAVLVITKGNMKAFLGSVDGMVPTLLMLIAVIGWVVYTMGAGAFRGWSALRYSTLSCLLGTATAGVITAAATGFGTVPMPTGEGMAAAAPHLLFMMIFPGVIALLGWNIGVGILSPINGLLFINFVPVTTLLISVLQGNPLTGFELFGTALIILALLSNNLYLRMNKKSAPVSGVGKRQMSV